MPPRFERTNLLSLQLFLAVVDLGSIANVGRKHFIASTAVTKRMQELEEEYGVQLLIRTSKGVSPTAAGDALAHHVRNMSSLAERMRIEMNEYAEGVLGHVRLIANASALIEYLAQEIVEFTREHAGVKIDLREARSEQVVSAVRDGDADIGIFAPPVHLAPELETYPYREDRLVAAVPANHALANRSSVSFDELRQHPIIGVHGASSLSTLLMQEARGELMHSFRVASNDVARWMVSKGLGITVLPEGLIRPHEASLQICAVPISDAFAKRALMLCVRESAKLPRAARTMFDALRPLPAGASGLAGTQGPLS